MHPSKITAIIIAVFTLLGCLFSPEPGVIALGGLCLAAGVLMLWTERMVPVLLLPFMIQWISVAVKPIEMMVTGKELAEFSQFGGDLTTAAAFSFIALTCLAGGMRLGILSMKRDVATELAKDAALWPEKLALSLSLGLILVGHAMGFLTYSVAGLTEVFLALANLTYAGLFMLVYWGIRARRRLVLVAAITVAEIVLGMSGFFGVFRTTLFTVALAAVSAQIRFRPQTLIISGVLGMTALVALVFWTAVKPDYRFFLNGGEQVQGSSQPITARLSFLADRAGTFDKEEFDRGFEGLLDRASYIDFLSLTLDFVPANTPHEHGERTFRSAVHIFTPRIFFPDKPALESDTEVTAKYTGLSFQNYSYLSISLGYLGELYVDFGQFGACLAMLIFGAIVGLACRSLLESQRTPMLLNVGLAMMLTIPICYFEQALIKTVGGTTMTIIVVLLLQRFLLPFVLRSLLDRLQLHGAASGHFQRTPRI